MSKPAVWILILACGVGPALGVQAPNRDLGSLHARLIREVRHQLLLLPDCSVFDNLQFEVTDIDTVVLTGQVTRPILKSSTEQAVRKLEGVGKIVNRIEVLPPSPDDDRLRLATYRAILAKPGLDKYGVLAVPSIHVIVKNGSITLLGVVASEADKDLAGLAAREVPGAFQVSNNLRIENREN